MITISIKRHLKPMSESPPTTAPVLAFHRGSHRPYMLYTNGQQWYFATTHGTAHNTDFHGWTELRLTQ